MQIAKRIKKTWILAIVALMGVAQAGPVSWYGALQTQGSKLMDESKTNQVQLKGPSLYWSNLEGAQWYNERVVSFFAEQMHISVIRAAMAIKYWKENSEPINSSETPEDYGYLTPEINNAKEKQIAIIERVIDAAILNDIYVLVDWHSHNAQNEQSEAIAFFTAMATKYKDVPNVLWEIYNEPVGSYPSSYAQAVTSAIRGTGNNNLIIVGSSSWSANPLEGVQSGLASSYANIAFALHAYTNDHLSYTNKGDAAMSAGGVVFVTEWGPSNYAATAGPNTSNAQSWIQWMDQKKVSSCQWSVFANSQASIISIFKDGTTPFNLSLNSLTAAGSIFKGYMPNGAAPSGVPYGKDVTINLKEGESKVLTSSDLGLSAGASISAAVLYGESAGNVTFDGTSLTYQSLDAGSGSPDRNHVVYAVSDGTKSTLQRATFVVDRAPTLHDTTLDVSHARSLQVYTTSLNAISPEGDAVSFEAVTGGTGTVVMAADKKSFEYTPPANYLTATELSRLDPLSVTVVAGTHTVTKTVNMNVRRYAPTAYNTKTYTVANTDTLVISLKEARISDKDRDTVLSFYDARINLTSYPGKIELFPDSQYVMFYPDPGYIGTLPIAYIATDGMLVSEKWPSNVKIKITGTGQDISTLPQTWDTSTVVTVGTIENPTIRSATANYQWLSHGVDLLLQKTQNVQVQLYSLTGALKKDLYHGQMEAGSHLVQWGTMERGLYVVRVRIGSQAFANKILIQ